MAPLSTNDKIGIILGQATRSGFYGVEADATPSQWGAGFGTAQPFVRSETFVCGNEQVQLLRILYAGLPAIEQGVFGWLLLSQLRVSNALVVAQLLVDTRRLDLVSTLSEHRLDLVAAVHQLSRQPKPAITALWNGLRLKLAFEPSAFTEDDLDVLRAAARDLKTRLPRRPDEGGSGRQVLYSGAAVDLDHELDAMLLTLDMVWYRRLRAELLENANPEINTDRIEVAARIKRLGLNDDLLTALDAVERKLQTAATPSGFKDAMDSIRSVLEGVVVESARSLAAAAGGSPPGAGTKPFGPYLQYLRDRGRLTKSEEQMVAAAYGMMSHEGTHALRTEPEKARVARSIAIELALLILGRMASP